MTIELLLLGPLEARSDGAPVSLGSGKARALLADLALRLGEAVSPDRLIDDLWGEHAPDTASHAVQVYVSQLRKALGKEAIATGPAGYRLQLDPERCDLRRFARLSQSGRKALEERRHEAAADAFREALALWRGPPLADFTYERFAEQEIARLEELRMACVEGRFEAELALGRHDTILPEVEAFVAAEPLRERLRAQLMLGLYRCGRQADALDVYQEGRRLLLDELGIEPGPELHRLQAAILRHDPELAAAARRPPTNLPSPARPLLGRELELRDLHDLLAERRLVTITGAGGTGKTRFALEVASTVADSFVDGAFFVALAPLSDPEEVVAAIVKALPLQEQPERPLSELLAEYLSSRRLLLMLDNFEHLLAAAPIVADLLAAAPRVVVLVTSRERLQIAGEREYPLDPLGEQAAGELFCARVEDVVPDFVLGEADAAALRLICRRLDGLPLALELAAARVKLLGLHGLLDRLERHLEPLEGRRRDVPERQRTLRAAIQWSYELLDERERHAWLHLTVFAGGWTAEAAEEVAGADLDTLGSLLDKSLIRRGHPVDGEARFGMLQTIREFGLDNLERAGALNPLRDRHLRYYRDLAEHAEPELFGAAQDTWMRLLDADAENLHAALTHGLGPDGDVEDAARLAAALIDFWDMTGRYREARSWYASLVARRSRLDPGLAAGVALGLAHHGNRLGDQPTHIGYATEAATAYRRLGLPMREARALVELVWALAYSNVPDRSERAAAAVERAREVADTAGDQLTTLWSLMAMGIMFGESSDLDSEAARNVAVHEQVVEVCRGLGDRFNTGIFTVNLAEGMLMFGRFERADELLADAMECEHPLVVTLRLVIEAASHLLQDRFLAAVPAVRETLVRADDAGTRDVLGFGLHCAAWLAAVDGRVRRAGELIGAADRLLADTTPAPLWRTVFTAARAAAEQALGPDLPDAIADGARLRTDEAVERALESLVPRPAATLS